MTKDEHRSTVRVLSILLALSISSFCISLLTYKIPYVIKNIPLNKRNNAKYLKLLLFFISSLPYINDNIYFKKKQEKKNISILQLS